MRFSRTDKSDDCKFLHYYDFIVKLPTLSLLLFGCAYFADMTLYNVDHCVCIHW